MNPYGNNNISNIKLEKCFINSGFSFILKNFFFSSGSAGILTLPITDVNNKSRLKQKMNKIICKVAAAIVNGNV